MSVFATAPAEQRRGDRHISQNWGKLRRLRPPGHPKKGEPMQTQYIIFAGAIAACSALYLILKYTDDPIAKEIQEAQLYESKQKRMKKAIEE